MPRNRATIAQAFRDMKHEFHVRADYAAAKPSRHQRIRAGLGGTGDAHIASQHQFDKIREYCRDMERNEPVIGPLVYLAATNMMPLNLKPAPETGDEKLDAELSARWTDWADDARQCDQAWERPFDQQVFFELTQTFVDGDIFALLLRDGSVQQIEADRCAKPNNTRKNVVHGIELDGRRKVAYWFKQDPGQQRVERVRDMDVVDAYDEDGNPKVLHIYNPRTVRRITSTRGVSAFASVMERAGMIEDADFAELVKRQALAAIVFFLKRDPNFQGRGPGLGNPQTPNFSGVDVDTSTVDEIKAGSYIRGAPGEDLQAVTANVPNSEYFVFVRQQLTFIGMTIGMPLVMGLMDASETNFSGWRGAVDLARRGFRFNWNWYKARRLRPTYRWKVRRWALLPASAGGLGATARKLLEQQPANIYKHTWPTPGYPYIQPLQDAQADALQLTSGLASPAMIAQKQGRDWTELVTETVTNWSDAIDLAATKAAELNKKHEGLNLHWRDVLNLAMPDTLKTTLGDAIDQQGDNTDAKRTGERQRED